MNRNGLRWRDAPKDHGPQQDALQLVKRWGAMGVFTRMKGVSAGAERKTVMIDATPAFTDTRRVALAILRDQCLASDAAVYNSRRPYGASVSRRLCSSVYADQLPALPVAA